MEQIGRGSIRPWMPTAVWEGVSGREYIQMGLSTSKMDTAKGSSINGIMRYKILSCCFRGDVKILSL